MRCKSYDPAYGTDIQELEVGQIILLCVNTSDAMLGLKSILINQHLKCRRGSLGVHCVQPGSGLVASLGNGTRYFITYHGNRDFEVLRMEDVFLYKKSPSG